GRVNEVLKWLATANLPFRYARSETRLGYDANLRASISLARGRYCLLFGNDDALAESSSLSGLEAEIRLWCYPEVVITNYLELADKTVRGRITSPGVLGRGPLTGLRHFRKFSFVSGILLDRRAAQAFATVKWDGSEMYQMYLGCRILAAGGRLLGLERILVHKGVQIPGETVDSYATKACPEQGVKEFRLPLSQYGQVALDAARPYLSPGQRTHWTVRVMLQVLLFSYPPWLVEYRRVQSWRFALGVALGMRPRNLLQTLRIGWAPRWFLGGVYASVTLAGLIIPQAVFKLLQGPLYALAKRV
ncbi:MAG TPA: glycosyltransferase family 2 protein, partial [Verrucomicrobiae bacterium]|nr:glycosyltransferase family 2 protein [Verrucomicrobiae bacterium]